MKRALIVAPLFALGCTTDVEKPAPDTETQGQNLGESTQAYYFSGIGAGEMPTMQERVAIHLANRVRTAPYVWGIQNEDGDPVDPIAALTYQPFFAEAGRWQGAHAIQYQCFCTPGMMPAPQDYNTCCEMGLKNGEVQCVGPITTCEEGTEEADRWALLNRGPGVINNEFFWPGDLPAGIPALPGELAANFLVQNALGALFSPRDRAAAFSQVNTPIIPQECQPQFEPCAQGICTDIDTGANECDKALNPDCLGLCLGTDENPAPPCTLNEPLDPEICNPDEWQQAFYWTFAFGGSRDPVPVLSDGVAFQPGFTATEQNPEGTFGVVEPGEVLFSVRYHQPVGAPQSLKLAMNGSCFDMDLWVEPPTETVPVEGDMGPDMEDMEDMDPDMDTDMGEVEEQPVFPYSGLTYENVQSLGEGCYRFFYSAVDAEGFVYRFPSLGSLGVSVDAEGRVNLEDPDCPTWSETVPPAQCLPEVDECNAGEERPCYSGRPGTQDKGICELGTESCEQGRWSGKCEGEVRPEAEETCGDNLDNNCNGVVEENCPITPPDPEPEPEPDMGVEEDMGGEEDMGEAPAPGNSDSSDDGCGCTTVDQKQDSPYGLVVLGLFGAFILRRFL